MRRPLALLAIASAAAPGCDAPAAPAFGEARFSVDTDLTVPTFAARLRVDVFDGDGAWIASRDLARAHARDWPTTFSVFSRRASDRALVRLRAYPYGSTREYRGERFTREPMPGDDPAAPAPTVSREGPRLLAFGVDETPETEPLPSVAVDRLVLVELREGVVGEARVVLRGACAGVQADLAGQRSCTDGGPLVPISPVTLERPAAPRLVVVSPFWMDASPGPESAGGTRASTPTRAAWSSARPRTPRARAASRTHPSG